MLNADLQDAHFTPIDPEAEFKFDGNIKERDPTGGEGYESCEHFAAGNKAFGEFIENITNFFKQQDQKDDADPKMAAENDNWRAFTVLLDECNGALKLSEKVRLEPGQIVALAGDFYGIPKEPISFGLTEKEQIVRFKKAYANLVDADEAEMQQIIKRINADYVAIQENFKKGRQRDFKKFASQHEEKSPSQILDERAAANNTAYALITTKLVFPGGFFYSRYAELAAENYDHFGDEARNAYIIGTKVALATAKDAFAAEEPAAKAKLFMQALTEALFACHYLTDLFSAGHLRVPRKSINDYVATTHTPLKSKVAGLLSMKQHNADNMSGLYVSSAKHPEIWHLKGDDCYFEQDQKVTREEIQKAVVAALMDIYNVFQRNEVPETYSALAYLPKVADDQRNGQPLFKVNPANKLDVQMREQIGDPQCAKYISGWSPTLMVGKAFLTKESEQQQVHQSLEHGDAADDKKPHTCTML